MAPLLVTPLLLAGAVRAGVVGATLVEPAGVPAPPDTTLVSAKVVSKAERELAERGMTCGSVVDCAAALGAWARLDRVVLLERSPGHLRASSVNVASAAVDFVIDVRLTTPARALSPAVEASAVSAALFRDAGRVVPDDAPPAPSPSLAAPAQTSSTSTSTPVPALGLAAASGAGALAVVAAAAAAIAWPSDSDLRAGAISAADFNRRQDFAVAAGAVAGGAAVVSVAGAVVFAVCE